MAPKSFSNVRFGGKSQTLKQKVVPRARKDLMKARATRRNKSLRDCSISDLTRRRYLKECDLFLQYCCLYREAPFVEASWDTFMRTYIEQCWSEGEPLGRATYALCGLEWAHPPLKGCLKGSWQLIRTWEKEEPPARATPFTAEIVIGLASLAIAGAASDLAALLLVGFDALSRTGELFTLTAGHIRFDDDDRTAIIQLPGTKTGQRFGADQVCVVHSHLAVSVLKAACSNLNSCDTILRRTPSSARKALQHLLTFYALDNMAFGWYSLRRGGASAHFQKSGSMEATLVLGRWSSQRTARLYIETGLAETVQLSLTAQQRALFRCFAPCLQRYRAA
jgi:hypothetical protein